MSKIDSIIFDLDGTLWSSAKAIVKHGDWYYRSMKISKKKR